MEGKIKTRVVSLFYPDLGGIKNKKIDKKAFRDLFPKDNATKILSIEKIFELLKKTKEGDEEAKELLIADNMRSVVYLSMNYLGMGMSPDELVECCIAGLSKAFEVYDERKDIAFGNFISNYMIKSITEALKEKGTEEVKYIIKENERIRKEYALINAYLKWNPLPPKIKKAIDLLSEKERILLFANKGIGMEKMSPKEIFLKWNIYRNEQPYMMNVIMYKIIKEFIEFK